MQLQRHIGFALGLWAWLALFATTAAVGAGLQGQNDHPANGNDVFQELRTGFPAFSRNLWSDDTRAVAKPVVAEVGAFATDPVRVSLSQNPAVSVELTPIGARRVAARGDKNHILFSEAFVDVDVVYVKHASRLAELLVLRSNSAPKSLSWFLSYDKKTTAVFRDKFGGLGVRDTNGATSLRIPAPRAVDAAGMIVSVHMDWNDITQLVTLSVDTAHAHFPVVIDPPVVGGPNLLVAGQNGAAQVVGTDLDVPPKSIQVALGGSDVFCVCAGSGMTLVGGGSGRVQLVNSDGLPIGNFATALGGSVVRACSYNGESWLVVGDSGRIQIVDSTGAPVGTFVSIFQNQAVYGASWDGTNWLVVGTSGRVQLIDKFGVPIGTFATALGGLNANAVAYNGTQWLVGGESGRVQRVSSLGVVVGNFEPALAGSTVNALAWDGANWLAAGASGRSQLVAPTGIPVATSYIQSGGTWRGAAASAVGWLVVGTSGVLQYLTPAGALSGSVLNGIEGQHYNAVAWVGTHFLGGGGNGRIQRATEDGKLMLPYVPTMGGNIIEDAASNGTNWFVVGSAYGQLLDQNANPLTPYSPSQYIFPGGYGVHATAWNGTQWIAVGDSGRLALVNANGAVQPTIVLSGLSFYAVVWTGTEWIGAGSGGKVFRISPTGQKLGEVTAIDGTNVRTVATNGQRILVAGDSGKFQIFTMMLQPVTGVKYANLSFTIRGSAHNGDEFLVVGDGGYVQRIGVDGSQLSYPAVALGGDTVYDAAWLGTEWVVVGNKGLLQVVDPSGQPSGASLLTLDGLSARTVVYSGGALAANQNCAWDAECASGLCLSGICACAEGCTLDGLCIADGEPHPKADCLVCDSAVSKTTWSPVSDGSACGANDACVGSGTCSGGVCSASILVNCDDNNPCTDDGCDGATGTCTYDFNDSFCDDGDVCTSGDVCNLGICGGNLTSCDDENPCTDDTCDSLAGCMSVSNSSACDDGNLCTESDTCADGGCTGTAKSDGESCDDGDNCTVADTCQGGQCIQGSALADCNKILVGAGTATGFIPASLGLSPKSTQIFIGATTVYTIAHAGGKTLVGGASGRIQFADEMGLPIGNYVQVNGGFGVRGMSWNGTEWLVGGDSGRCQRVSADGQAVGPVLVTLTGSTVHDVAWNGVEWLVVGDSGKYQRVAADGTIIGTPGIAIDGFSLYAASWGQDSWLVGGESGRVQRIAPDGTLMGTYQRALSGSTVESIAWNGSMWLVVGASAKSHGVGPDGLILQQTYAVHATSTLNAVAAHSGGFMAGGNGGYTVSFGADGLPLGSAKIGLDSSHIYGIAWTGSGYLYGGASGRVQMGLASGVPKLPYFLPLAGNNVNAVSFNGERWLAADVLYSVVIDAAGNVLNPYVSGNYALSGGYGIRSAATDGVRWLLAGDSGRYRIIDSNGSFFTNTFVITSSYTIEATAWNGSNYLLVGSSGHTRRVNAAGVAQGSANVIVNGGVTQRAAASDGKNYLVGGDLGRYSILDSTGQLLGPMRVGLSNQAIYAASFNGEHYLIGGDEGQIQRIFVDGTPAGPSVTALNYGDIRSIVWTGAHWVIGGEGGRVQKVGPDGQTVGSVELAMDELYVRAMAYGGGFIAEAKGCSSDVECSTKDCVSGVCLCAVGCAVGGICVADGSKNPQNGCQVCDSTANPVGWTAVSDGITCGTESACAEAGVCTSGQCVQNPVLVCDDSNECTDDVCDPSLGECVFSPNTSACDDGDVCTANDGCNEGQCVGASIPCDDGNLCTDDFCDSQTGCVHLANATACDDGNPCTGNDFCANEACVSGAAVSDGTPCPGDDACSAGNICKSGSCVIGETVPSCAKLLVSGGNGYAQEVAASLDVPAKSILTGFGSATIYAFNYANGKVLGGSDAAQVQLVGLAGNPIGSATSALAGQAVYAIAHNGTEWLAAGGSGRIQRVTDQGVPIGTVSIALSGYTVNAMAFNGSHFLLGGDGGRFQLVDSFGFLSGSVNIGINGYQVNAVASNGTDFLIAGASGYVQRIGANGEPLGAPIPTLSGSPIYAAAWNGANWLVAGSSGRTQLLNPDGTVVAESFGSHGSMQWRVAIALEGTFYLFGTSGAMAKIGSNGNLVGAVDTGLDGFAIYAATWTGTEFIMGGAGGRIQRGSSSGNPILPYKRAMVPYTIESAAFNGQSWLVVGSIYRSLLDRHGNTVVPYVNGQYALAGGYGVHGVSYNGENFLTVGDSGRYALVGNNGLDIGGTKVASGSSDFYAVAWNGQQWLACGYIGTCRRFDKTSTVLGSSFTVIGGAHARAVASNGAFWLVAGDSGRIQFVDPSGVAVGTYATPLTAAIRTVAWNGSRWFVAGDNGKCRMLLADGTPDGPEFSRLNGNTIYSVAWTGYEWVVGGNSGLIQRLLPDGGVVGTVAVVLDGQVVRTVGYGGANLMPGSVCGADFDCLSGTCLTGVCTADCVISGNNYLLGAKNPDNACEVCDPAQSSTEWSALATGAACNDGDPCTVNDICQDGGCVSGAPKDCADATDCTVDICNSATGLCDHTYVGGQDCGTTLFAGGNKGTIQKVAFDLNVPPKSIQVALGGADVNALSYNGESVLAVGGGGKVQRIGLDSIPMGTAATVIGGNAAYAAVWQGSHWLVAGTSGRIHRVGSDGQPIGNYTTACANFAIRGISWNGTNALCVADGGRMQLVDGQGTALGTAQTVFGGNQINAASWNGTYWLIGGGGGLVQRVDAAGQLVGTSAVALLSSTVRTISWNGSHWYVAGDSGRSQLVDTNGVPLEQTYQQEGSTVWGAAAMGSSWLVGHASGIRKVSPQGSTVISQSGVLENSAVYAVSTVGEEWFIGGSGGRIQRVAAAGTVIVPYVTVLNGANITNASWNGTHWLVAGGTLVQVVDPDGLPVSSSVAPFTSNYAVRGVSWGQGYWLAVGDAGRVNLVSSSGQPFNEVNAGENNQLRCVSWNGERWLVSGANGYVREIATSGLPASPSTQILSGATAEACASNGALWNVVGGSGRSHTLSAVSSLGPVQLTLFNLTARTVTWNGSHWLVAGDAGYVQVLDSNGIPGENAKTALSGKTIYASAWTGSEWIVAGDLGLIQRLAPDGTPIGNPSTILDGNVVTFLGVGAATLAKAKPCSAHETCPVAVCVDGVCGCGDDQCAIDGLCYPGGALNPANPCQICTPTNTTTSWTTLADGTACTENSICTGEGTCANGSCALPTLIFCEDDNNCTDNVCDPVTGECSFPPNGVSCDDGDLCTAVDVCADGTCLGSVTTDCNDNDPCTDDVCDSDLGCLHTHNTAECDDNNPCTGAGVCEAGVCLNGSAVADGTNCSTGAPCTENDKCINGLCSAGPKDPSCAEVFVAGSNGSIYRIPSTLNLPPASIQTVDQAFAIYGAATGGNVTLVGGASGRIQRIDENGLPIGSSVVANNAFTIRAIAWNGSEWLVGGDSGRFQRVGADGVPIGTVQIAIGSSAIYSVTWNGSHYLLAGGAGRVQRVTADGQLVGTYATALEGNPIYAAAWGNGHWLVGGNVGRVQRVDADGVPVGSSQLALAGSDVNGIGYNGTNWLVAGASSRFQFVSGTGEVAVGTFVQYGTTWRDVECYEGGCLLVGNSGYSLFVPATGYTNQTVVISHVSYTMNVVAWAGTHFLIGGDGGRIQRASSAGPLLANFQRVLGNNEIVATAYNGTDHMVTGNVYHQVIAPNLVPKTVYDPNIYSLNGYGTYTAAHNGTDWLIAGGSGRHQLIKADGSATTVKVVSPGHTLYASSWNGSKWFVGGTSGGTFLINPDTAGYAPVQIAIGGSTIRGASWNGTHWLVVGDSGRTQRIDANGLPVGNFVAVILNFTARAVAWNGQTWLVGGDKGYVQRVGADGVAVGTAVDVLGGVNLYAVLWTGDSWLVAGDNGAIRRLNPDGSPLGPIETAMDGQHVRTASYTGPMFDAGKPCVLDSECLSGGCTETKTCAADCVIGGAAYVDGTANPFNSCEVCDVLSSATSWTVLGDGVPCTDGNECTVGDLCSSGVCVVGPTETCDDGVACTTDICNPTTGACSNTISGAPSCATCANGVIDNYPTDYGFESGSLAGTPFVSSGWNVTAASAYSGIYSLYSTNNVANSVSQLTVSQYTGTGNICFRVYGSSEVNDKFAFFVDGIKKFEGVNLSWQLTCTAVSEGQHTLMWQYTKNGSTNGGEDRYFLDDISIPLVEACDDGNSTDGDGCNGLCTSDETCGNGYADLNEACDDGNNVSGDGCNADCTSNESCGNGIVDLGEWCDDGNMIGHDECSTLCQPSGVCGDGTLDSFPVALTFESGDFSEAPVKLGGSGWSVTTVSAYEGTHAIQTNPVADNGQASLTLKVDTAAGDVCFAATGSSQDCCDFLLFQVDGVTKATIKTQAWQVTCVPVAAGLHTLVWSYTKNGSITQGQDTYWIDAISTPNITPEVCDDGNVDSGDGCSADCESDESCGNGYTDVAEACDDGNGENGDGCSADCLSDESCGNNIVDANEQCDDGNLIDLDGCSPLCHGDTVCGNGVLETAYPDFGFETGNAAEAPFGGVGSGSWAITTTKAHTGSYSIKSDNHTANSIGKLVLPLDMPGGDVCFRVRGTSEACCDKFSFRVDNTVMYTGVNMDWTKVCTPLTPGAHTLEWRYTKDGAVSLGEDTYYVDDIELLFAEVCDDGNTQGGDGCSAACHSEEVCGNFIKDVGEVCDDGNTVSADGCSANCLSDETCGNGIVDEGELCDLPPPGPIGNLAASSAAAGFVMLSWAEPEGGAVGYAIYRSTTPTETTAGMTQVATTTGLNFADLPPIDGGYFYRVRAYFVVEKQGADSDQVSAESDRTSPTGTVALSKAGPLPIGTYAVTLTASEALAAPPTLAWTPAGGLPIPVALTPGANNTFGGALVIDGTTPNGPAVFSWLSADLVGNPGAPVLVGGTVTVDTVAPTAFATLVPVSPLKAGTVNVTVVTSELMATVPNLIVSMPGILGLPVPLVGVGNLFVGSFVVPGGTPDGSGNLTWGGIDLAGNSGNQWTGGNTFAVDGTAPVISISGVTNGGSYDKAVTITISAVDANLASVVGLLNGAPFVSGTSVGADGEYALLVTATDLAGNLASKTVSFSIDLPPAPVPTAQATVPLNGGNVLVSWTPSPSPDVVSYLVQKDLTTILNAMVLGADVGLPNPSPGRTLVKVIAVDAGGRKSAPKTLWIYPTQLIMNGYGSDGSGGDGLTRGYFDNVSLGVHSDANVAIPFGDVRLMLTDTNGNMLSQGTTQTVGTLPANSGEDTAHTVFCPTNPPDGALIRAELDSLPVPGTTVTYVKHWPMTTLMPDGPAVTPIMESLVKGQTNTLQVEINNWGTAPLEVVTALGGSFSPDVRVVLKNATGTTVYATGKLVDTDTVPIGQAYVAIIPPKSSYISAPIPLAIPAETKKAAILDCQVVRTYHGYGTAQKITGGILGSSTDVIVAPTP